MFFQSRSVALAVLSIVVLSGTANAQSSTERYTYDDLGRLLMVETEGGQNDGESQALQYDDAGNRTSYQLSTGTTSQPSDPPPAGTNYPPDTTSDSTSGACLTSLTINLTANDTDPEDNYPLQLVSVSRNFGGATATVTSASSVRVTFGQAGDISQFTYRVQDSLGAQANGQLSVRSSTCSGGSIQ